MADILKHSDELGNVLVQVTTLTLASCVVVFLLANWFSIVYILYELTSYF